LPAVSNTSPLILLAKVGLLAMLAELYGEVLIPPAVERELAAGGSAASAIAPLPWLNVRAPEPATVRRVSAGLDLGEAEAIALAIDLGTSGAEVILDDASARRRARNLGLAVTGTGGVVVVAKRRGLVVSVKEELDRLREAGMYLHDSAYAELVALGGESGVT
jgi:predicted nucleic acid-binding protein